jgi:predicted small lipoprotein YifL
MKYAVILLALSACGLKGELVRPADIKTEDDKPKQVQTDTINQDGTRGLF